MRIHIKFITKIGIDFKYYGVDLDEVCFNEGELSYYYSFYCWDKVPERIEQLLKSDIISEMQKEFHLKRPISEIENKLKLHLLNSIK